MATPHRFVALLRALNVGGHAVVTMPDLRAALAPLELAELATVGASGNLVFGKAKASAATLSRAIEARLADSLGVTTTAFVVGASELARVAAENPLASRAKTHHVHVVVLSRAPDAARIAALDALAGDDYAFAVRGNVLYMAYARALAGKRRSIDVERVLGVTATARTIGVVDRLIALAMTTAQTESGSRAPRARPGLRRVRDTRDRRSR
jgi:uncharacterized protein (DUF1697 family)